MFCYSAVMENGGCWLIKQSGYSSSLLRPAPNTEGSAATKPHPNGKQGPFSFSLEYQDQEPFPSHPSHARQQTDKQVSFQTDKQVS